VKCGVGAGHNVCWQERRAVRWDWFMA